MKIPLKTVYSAARDRAAGYVEEVKKRGKIEGNSVELSKFDFDYIAENFKLGSKPKAEIVKLEKTSEAVALIPAPSQVAKVTTSVKNLFN
jgi:hypothetical protein